MKLRRWDGLLCAFVARLLVIARRESPDLRILHVTEAMGSGVLTLVEVLSRRQAEQGAEVSLWFMPRPETPNDDRLRDMFDSRVALRRITNRTAGFLKYWSLIESLGQAARKDGFDVIHLHSSKAGAVGRIAAMCVPNRTSSVVYSPHGFAFLREDRSRLERHATRLAEMILAKVCDALVLTSASEQSLAQEELRSSNTRLLRTGIPANLITGLARPDKVEGPPKVGMVGRICYQKAPWRFVSVARALAGQADFVWIGGGSREDTERWMNEPAVEITGWLDAEELVARIDELDVLLFPTLWEGMAISLMQAQAQGVPAVVSDVVGNVDTIVDGRTGYVCANDEELIDAVRLLLTDEELRISMAKASIEWARESLLDTNLGSESLMMYQSVISKEEHQQF